MHERARARLLGGLPKRAPPRSNGACRLARLRGVRFSKPRKSKRDIVSMPPRGRPPGSKNKPDHRAGRPPFRAGWNFSRSKSAPATLATRHSDAITTRPKTTPKVRSEEHTSELQSLMRISYAVFCLKKKSNYTLT